MGDFSNDMTTLAEELIEFFGQDVTFTKVASSGYDTATLAYATNVTTTYDTIGAPLELSGGSTKRLEQQGIAVQAGMKELYIPSGTYVPAISDKVAIDSINYRVLTIQEFKTQGVVCAYLLMIGV